MLQRLAVVQRREKILSSIFCNFSRYPALSPTVARETTRVAVRTSRLSSNENNEKDPRTSRDARARIHTGAARQNAI